MPAEMGTFRVDIKIENPGQLGASVTVSGIRVDTGSELSWVPAGILESLGVERRKMLRFRQASGTILERWVGIGLIYAGGTSTGDDVVFGEPGDMVLLGARTLEGLNLRVDPVTKTLVDAGPAPAALLTAHCSPK
jgi:predicted aspartyl protease